MIPNNTKDMSVVSNVAASKTGQFSVDQASLGKIMSVLTNLYTDPEMAVVREYLTNALDAQIDAQKADPNYVWRPIEVTLPSHFSKEYKVRDFGIGMSVDDIENIYSKYGKSTKENSNDVTGMLGLGSKCALTYTGQFTITGFKDGVRTRAIISKDDNDIPVFMVVDTRATDEPNGVEISVPVRDRNSFATKCASFLRWWEDGKVLVNGEEPKKHGLKEAKPGVFITGEDSYGDSYSYIIMGNVPYAVNNEYIPDALRSLNVGFAAYVPMASVDFPPSREELFYNNRTKKVINEVADGLAEKVLEKYRHSFENAASALEAYNAYNDFPYSVRRNIKMQSLAYKGESIRDRISIPTQAGQYYGCRSLVWNYYDRSSGYVREINSISVSSVLSDNGAKGLFVTGVEMSENITATTKKKVRHYLDSNPDLKDLTSVYFLKDDVASVWFESVTRVSIDDIKAIKLPRTPAGKTAEPTYDIFEYTDGQTAPDRRTESGTITVPSGRTLVYVSPQNLRESDTNRGTSENAVAKALGDKFSLVVLAKNRFEKFLRLNTNAITLRDAFEMAIKDKAANATGLGQLVGTLTFPQTEFAKEVDSAGIDDPDLKTVIDAVNQGGVGDKYAEAEALRVLSTHASIDGLVVPSPPAPMSNPFDRYVLINRFGAVRPIEHMVIYANAVYALSQK